MNFSKYIKLFILQFFLCIVCFAQREKIDSLKKVLTSLKDTARIDCFNNLSLGYVQLEKKDSANYFAMLAYQQSNQVNYLHGMAIALARKARIVKHFDNDCAASEKLVRASLNYFNSTGNKEGINGAYHEMIYALQCQSRFEEAAEYNMKQLEFYKYKGNNEGIFNVLKSMSALYKEAGNYEKSFYYIQQCRQYARENNNLYWLQCALFGLGGLFMKIDDYHSAVTNYRQAFEMDNPQFEKNRIDEEWDIWIKMEYAEIFSHLGQFDSAWHYFELYKPATVEDRYYRIYLVSTGEYYFLQKKYEQALQNFLQGLNFHKKLNDRNEIQRSIIFAAQTYLALEQYDSAMHYGKEALNIAYTTKAKQIIRDACKVIYTVFDWRKQKDSANIYFREYSAERNFVANDQVKTKLAVSNYEQKIELLDTENQLKEQKLRQAAQQKNFLIVGILAITLMAIIVFRIVMLKRRNEKLRLEHTLQLQKLESEKTKSELQQQATELEMQALRAQMNPHFIFNSLNSINRFILQNNKALASEYLTKFSRLVRLILQNSQSALITLESELESLQLYLELEAVRFDHHFEFNIKVDNELETDIVKVPPLIIQPYAENAIWHGLMHKEEKGNLEIELFQEDDFLFCKITDDGVGRKKATEIKSKSAATHKSMGMQITASRIEMLQQKKQLENYIKITDLVLADGSAGGTEVILKIPITQ
jgi:LytS/YehU family sensor histidine kinase